MIQQLKPILTTQLPFHTFWAEQLFAELAAFDAGSESQKKTQGLLCSLSKGH